jgi:hypothetical protein
MKTLKKIFSISTQFSLLFPMSHKTFLFALLTLAFIPTASASFPDVTAETKYKPAIEYLAEKGIINGYSNGTFGPNNTLTRAELLKILLEAQDGFVLPPVPSEPCFPDVGTAGWFVPYVCYAKEIGMVEGFPDGSFQPNKSVSKAEAVKMLVESRDSFVPDSGNIQETFSDVDATQWYAPYVKYMLNENLLPEKDDTLFTPAKETPRNLIAEYLYRTLVREEKKKELNIGIPITISTEEYDKIKNIVTPIREFYYGNYWLELTDEDLMRIPEGVQYKVEEGAFQIGGVDPLLDELEIPVELQAVEGDGDEKGLYILQYVARNMTDWNQRIKDLGIDKIGYTGGTNYLVWASPNELEQAKQFDFVRAVVPYHGEFKIRPNLKDKFGQLVDIDVWYYFDGENYEKTRNRLIGLGGVSKDLHPRTPTANGEQSMRFGFQLDETTLYELARMPQVISLSWGAPIVPTTR